MSSEHVSAPKLTWTSARTSRRAASSAQHNHIQLLTPSPHCLSSPLRKLLRLRSALLDLLHQDSLLLLHFLQLAPIVLQVLPTHTLLNHRAQRANQATEHARKQSDLGLLSLAGTPLHHHYHRTPTKTKKDKKEIKKRARG